VLSKKDEADREEQQGHMQRIASVDLVKREMICMKSIVRPGCLWVIRISADRSDD